MKIMTIDTAKLRKIICSLLIPFYIAALLSVRVHAQPLAADVAAGPRLTQTQAVQIAKSFCQKIGQPVTAPGQATFPATADYDTIESWLPMWRIYFSHQGEVHIVDRTGTVTHYSNIAYSPNTDAPPGQALPQTEALNIARATLKLLGSGGN